MSRAQFEAAARAAEDLKMMTRLRDLWRWSARSTLEAMDAALDRQEELEDQVENLTSMVAHQWSRVSTQAARSMDLHDEMDNLREERDFWKGEATRLYKAMEALHGTR